MKCYAESFGFKGSALTRLWQVVVKLNTHADGSGIGIGVFSPLWSDASLFTHYGEEKSNSLMLEITKYALSLLENRSFDSPIDATVYLAENVYDFAQEITSMPELRKTFVLNALVPIDFALWQLYAHALHTQDFDMLYQKCIRSNLPICHGKLARIPLITYGTSLADVKRIAENGASIVKIKLGNDPAHNGSTEEMLAWDMNRITQLHALLQQYQTEYTENQKIAYYLDLNGRYPNAEALHMLLSHIDAIDAKKQVLILEEPFEEDSNIPVSQFDVPISADESAHGLDDVKRLIANGYSVMALKPVAKTMSISLLVEAYARAHAVPCFVADLTVNPMMVDWNKAVAARIMPIPGMKIGMIESNGPEQYVHWDAMCSAHSCPGADWIYPHDGVFALSDAFYQKSGGIFDDCPYYAETIK